MKQPCMSELYELPKGWEWKTIDDFATIKGGKRIPKGKKLSEHKTPYPYIRVSDFNDFGSVDTNNIQYVTEDIFNVIKNYTISSDDIYISIAGTIGKTGIIPTELNNANLTENAAKLVFNSHQYDKNYLLYFTNTNFFLEQIGLATKAVAMPKMALVRLKKVFIPIPPLSEQQRIVKKLDLLFAKIDKAIFLHQKNINEAEAFMGSVLNEVFEELEEQYGHIQLNDICTKITDGSHNPPKGIEFSDYIMISSKNIHNNLISFDNPRYLTVDDYNMENKRTNVAVGDVLLTIVGTIGRVAVVDTEQKFTLQRSVAVLKPIKESTDSKFIMYSLQKNVQIITNEAKGAAQKGIYLNSVKQLNTANAPLNIQQKVVQYLDDISKKIEILKRVQNDEMDSLKALKASILDKAFRGEI